MKHENSIRIAVWGIVSVGILLGLCGAAIGAYAGRKNVYGPRERSFVVRSSILSGVATVLFGIALLLLPPNDIWYAIIAYLVASLLCGWYWDRRQKAIRAEEK